MKQIYYPKTTASQREKLFKEWGKSKDIKEACKAARVSERTYYYGRIKDLGGKLTRHQF